MKKAILQTIAYADIFDYPLLASEVWEWLIMNNFQFPISNFQFKKALFKLLKERNLEKKGEFYYLVGKEGIVEIRKRRERLSASKIKRAENIAGILRLIPWVKLIGITGGLARKNVESKDDIDLFFITSKNRLWLSRGLVVLVLRILGVYRRPRKIKDMICPNMFISEDSLEIKPHDLFCAHEVLQMRPIMIRGNVYERFLTANLWAGKFLPNKFKDTKIVRYEAPLADASGIFSALRPSEIPPKENSSHCLLRRSSYFGCEGWTSTVLQPWFSAKADKDIKDENNSLPNFFISQFLNILEIFSRKFQLWYMAEKRTSEVVSDSIIKFHPQDCREKILKEYHFRLQNLKNEIKSNA